MVLLLVLGVLLFGRKLPELGRSVGKTFVEFKKGVKGLEDEVESASANSSNRPHWPNQNRFVHRNGSRPPLRSSTIPQRMPPYDHPDHSPQSLIFLKLTKREMENPNLPLLFFALLPLYLLHPRTRAFNSAVECYPHTVEVTGSNPVTPISHYVAV